MGVREFRGLIPKREQEIVKTPSEKKEPGHATNLTSIQASEQEERTWQL